jgi:hypothetical protein
MVNTAFFGERSLTSNDRSSLQGAASVLVQFDALLSRYSVEVLFRDVVTSDWLLALST